VDIFLDLIFNHLNKIAKKELKKEKLEKERKEAEAKAAEEAANEAIRRAKAKQKEKLEKHFNQFDKFNMDFIVGLDSEEKCIIMPGEFN
jgi:DNA-binding protein H-NS